MRQLFVWALALGVVAAASARMPSTSNVFQPEQKPWNEISRQDGVRVQGDTVADPFYIGSLPFSASGTTCTFINDYDYACPYTGSTSADVVYRYVPAVDGGINVDLCASTYDTKVYIFANTIDNVIACNDDYCDYQSNLHNVPLVAGNTYYIVVDGYGGSCGSYYLDVTDWLCSCYLACPPGGILEGEPDCYDGYVDTYNGGCNVVPAPVFQVLEPTGGDITICGTTGVYDYNGEVYRDTDWYELDLTEAANICLSGISYIPCYFFIIDGRGGCAEMTVVASGLDECCVAASDICYLCDPGTWWAWAGPSAWDPDYLCGNVYLLTIAGYSGGTPAVSTTWGRVKGLFR
jgi:hypothetical protein